MSDAATVNPCTLCAPLGAAIVTAGVRGAIPILHGAQGCATYIRRYVISHFREPMDVASSSLGEAATILGGGDQLSAALENVFQQYAPDAVTIATTCVAETIGEDVPMLLRKFAAQSGRTAPLVFAPTPSYVGGHIEGFHTMTHALVRALAQGTGPRSRVINVFPPMVSPADLRHLREIVSAFGVGVTMLPDYSDTLDGAIAAQYQPLPDGGTPVADIAAMNRSMGSVDLTMTGRAPRASSVLEPYGVFPCVLGLPIGVRQTDLLVDVVETFAQSDRPAWLTAERGRLLDAYADGHKYVFGKRLGIYGDPELVAALASFALEIGARPVVCATGARNRALPAALAELALDPGSEVLDDTDFASIEAACRRTGVELLIGNSKGYRMARALDIPLLRVGFPIHDRIGAGRILHIGYRGTLHLFDAVVNLILEQKQDSSAVGFSYQ